MRSKYNHVGKIVVSEAENAFLHIEYYGGDICTETVWWLRQSWNVSQPQIDGTYNVFLAISVIFPYHSKSSLDELYTRILANTYLSEN